MVIHDCFIIAAILFAGAIFSIWIKKLTVAAAIAGIITGALVFAGAGYTGVSMMATFFLLGTAATSWNKKQKEKYKAAEDNNGRRKASQVLANTGTAGIAGCLAYFYPEYQPLYRIIISASFASAVGDTLSSELGMVYGKRFFNILTLKQDEPGLDGVVSIEGTLIGMIGSALIAVIYSISFGFNWFGWIIICGTIGNLADSILGAALERKNYLKNDAVNFLNTLIAALAAWGIYVWF